MVECEEMRDVRLAKPGESLIRQRDNAVCGIDDSVYVSAGNGRPWLLRCQKGAKGRFRNGPRCGAPPPLTALLDDGEQSAPHNDLWTSV